MTLPVVLQGTDNGGWEVMADSKLLRHAGGVVIKPFDPIQIAPTGSSSHAEIILANRLGEQRVLCVAPSGQLLQGSCYAALDRQQGFNLVEIMVSMVLAVMVFLGLAKGQVVSLQQAHYSLQSTLATIEASNSVERDLELAV
ncbi:prepilin-type N-terminal cleavage/methylation domain-containing protein [Aeromonas sp. A-5]|uniref:type IV pilus modification PilV family protein n=1 Tax=Aeromonas ichthyocola TaxID=3367746 RepID=UPI0038E28A87